MGLLWSLGRAEDARSSMRYYERIASVDAGMAQRADGLRGKMKKNTVL